MKDRAAGARPRSPYWWCQIGGWGLYFAVNVASSQAYLPFSWRLLASFALLSGLGILLTHAYRGFLIRRNWLALPIRKLLPRALGANLLLAVVLVVALYLYFVVVPTSSVELSPRGRTGRTAMLFIFLLNDFIILTLWSAIYYGVVYLRRHRTLELERYQAQTALAEAELRGLKSQLNPHFVFNSLNSVRALVLENPPRAQEAITHMAEILRYHLESGERSLVPLADEITTAEQYLALELIRFDDRLTVERTFDERALAFLVPPLALQTLVENAVKYGVSRERGPGTIRLSAAVEDHLLEVSVRNTGSLQDGRETNSTGLGLGNLRTRLRLLFADRASFVLHEPEPGWVEARITLPATHTLEADRL